MKFGFVVPNFDPYGIMQILDSGVAAEEAGFDSCLVAEHVMLPYTNRSFDAWGILFYLAAKTSRIDLGTCITLLPLRHPTLLAKMATTLDLITNGRTILGVSVGWHKPEFDAYGNCGLHQDWNETSHRVRRMRESLEIMDRLWRQEKVDYKGKYYHVDGAVLDPKPASTPRPRVWIGGTGDYILKMTAKMADGWISRPRTQTATREALMEQMLRLESYSKSCGRIRPVTRSFFCPFIVPDGVNSIAPMPYAFCGKSEAISKVEMAKELGFHYFLAWFYPPNKMKELLTQFSKEIILSF